MDSLKHASEENDRLRQERDAAFRQLAELRKSLDRLTQMVAGQNERLDQLVSMLRRREEQLTRSEREVRKLRRKLGLDDDPEPDDTSAPVPVPEPSDEPPLPPDASSPTASGGERAPSSDEPPGDPAKRPRSSGGRRPPPANLDGTTEHHAVCACSHCGGTQLLKKDVLVSRKFDVVPSYVRCRTIHRDLVICADCGGRTTAEMPPMPCDRALFTSAFLAWLVVMKFELLVPLDRLRRLVESQGVRLSEPTLVHLIALSADLADPVDGQHWKQLKAGEVIAFDGTGLKVLVPGQAKAWNGYLEVFTRGVLTVFQFAMTKHGDGLFERLSDFEGTLVCDAESRHAQLFVSDERTEANCNAHARRKFRDAEKAHPHRAAQGGRFITAMYALEDQARHVGLLGEELLQFRQRRTGRVVRRFKTWLEGVLAQPLPPSDLLRKAVRYTLNHFEALTQFVSDAQLPLDNNACERDFQHHAKLRLGSLFAGSVEGAHRWATLLGVVRTAQKVGVDVQAYLTWLFDRRGTDRQRQALPAADLTPMAYKARLQDQLAA